MIWNQFLPVQFMNKIYQNRHSAYCIVTSYINTLYCSLERTRRHKQHSLQFSYNWVESILQEYYSSYCKVANSSMSQLVSRALHKSMQWICIVNFVTWKSNYVIVAWLAAFEIISGTTSNILSKRKFPYFRAKCSVMCYNPLWICKTHSQNCLDFSISDYTRHQESDNEKIKK